MALKSIRPEDLGASHGQKCRQIRLQFNYEGETIQACHRIFDVHSHVPDRAGTIRISRRHRYTNIAMVAELLPASVSTRRYPCARCGPRDACGRDEPSPETSRPIAEQSFNLHLQATHGS